MQVPPPPPPEDDDVSGQITVLPPGWAEYTGPNGQPYYFQASTGVSTYERPPAQSNAPPPPPAGFQGSYDNTPSNPQPVASGSGNANAADTGEVNGLKEKKKKKEKPVEKLPIPGTPWLRITTNQGNVFYTNTETKTSVWTVPDEIKDAVDALQTGRNGQIDTAKQQEATLKAQAEAARLLQEKEEEMQRLREELEREREASRKRKAEEEEQEEKTQQANTSTKRAKVEDEPGDDNDPEQDEEGNSDEEEKDAPLEDWQLEELQKKAEMEADLQEPVATLPDIQLSSEESIALFKTMLAEKDINPMRPWDTELPKFINDPRYKSVKMLRERRDLFDEHCKQIVRERRAQKAASAKEKADPASAYRALLIAEVTSTRTHWEDFRKKHKKDARFRDFGRDDREREKAFRTWLKDLGEIKRASAEKAEEQFRQMLSEQVIPEDAVWSNVKGKMTSDPRYNGVASSSQREDIFKKYMSSRTKVSNGHTSNENADEAKRSADEDRKARQAASLREREEKVRKDRAVLDRVAGRGKEEAAREESHREYLNLLIDAVRDPDARWSDMLSSFERDPRFVRSHLSTSEKRRLFDDHLDSIHKKRIDALEGLFAMYSPTLQTDFEDVYASISANPIVTRLDISADRVRRYYNDWSSRRYDQARKDFEAMLSESNFVEYWGRLKQESASKADDRAREALAADTEGDVDEQEGPDLRQMAAQIDLKQLQAVLKHDKRYTTFDYDPPKREQWIREHVEGLSRPKQTVHQQ